MCVQEITTFFINNYMKNEYINIRVSKEEKIVLREIAKRNKMTVSKYLIYNGLVDKKLKITQTIEIEDKDA